MKMSLDIDRVTALWLAGGTVVLAIFIQACLRLAAMLAWARRMKTELRGFDGPKPHWLYGHMYQFGKGQKGMEKFKEFVKEFKTAFAVWVGPFTFQMRMFHPDYLHAICKTAEPKSKAVYRFITPWLGNGLLISEGKTWARARRLLTPAFHFDILKPYIKVFGDSTNIMMDKWRSSLRQDGVDSASFDMFEHVSLMTLDSILKCAFSYDSDVQTQGKGNPYIKAVYELAELAVERVRFFPYHFDWLYYVTYSGYRFRKACTVAHNLSKTVIKSRKEALKQQGSSQTKRKYLDFLDILLAARDSDGNGLTDNEIKNEVDTFMFEGHDTTASGISWCLYNLARHSEYQELCREEINKVMGDRDMLTWDDMSELSMLTMCIKESMRIHPPVPGVSRQLTKPLVLPDDRSIPKDSPIGISIYGVHHNPHVWEHPEKFDPYRFTPENSKGRSPYAYIPFSAGPRNCIGQNFAMNEMRTCIALVLKHFRLSVDETKEVNTVPELVLRSKTGLWLNVSPIKH